jgi:hypothetical protein
MRLLFDGETGDVRLIRGPIAFQLSTVRALPVAPEPPLVTPSHGLQLPLHLSIEKTL